MQLFLPGCNSKDSKPKQVLFETLNESRTGLVFSNKLSPTPTLNMLRYMYFYNGAGAAAGDFNNDGLADIFFAANQSPNKLYINTGDLHFKDVSTAAGIPVDGAWSTGVAVADINNDGLLDIYVCRVGNFEKLQSHNQLLICQGIKNGIPFYNDEAKSYGLDFSGFSTQAAFFDYDMDGDLDMFLLNHSLHYNSTFTARSNFEGTHDPLSGDILFRNDGGHFTDVSAEAGINQSSIGYGLGIVVSDLNLDGYPDIYIGNDFHENDYLYINNGHGGFKDMISEATMHTSQFSMGVDAADINNDALPDIISADMLPSDPVILKRSLGEDEYNTFLLKIQEGYHYQYPRNSLQLNRGNGLFSETGLYSDVYATDWSWSTLWIDFDNDGLKDLFVSNGIPKRLNDIDYINYISNEEIQSRMGGREMRSGDMDMQLIDKFPQIKLPNRFFKNKGNVSFEDISNEILDNRDTYSNGSTYADFDNDGDIDIVVNNIEDAVLLYRNKANDHGENPSVRINLEGPPLNRNAVGARLLVFSGDNIRNYEKYPVRGFQSSMETALLAGLGKDKIDSAILIWPDNTYQHILFTKDSLHQKAVYTKGLPKFEYNWLKKYRRNNSLALEDFTKASGLLYRHAEDTFVDFDREPLLPFMLSAEGPALATGDANADGLDDVFIGASRMNKPALFIQDKQGIFKKSKQPALDNDSAYEDIDACWIDVNHDGLADLVVASGGNESSGRNIAQQPRVYINHSDGKLERKPDAFHDVFLTASCVAPCDFNNDGYIDLFIGGRAVTGEYGKVPDSYLLQNDGKGNFTDVTADLAPGLKQAGMVKHAVWADVDGDKDQDLVISVEWGGIIAFINNGSKFYRTYITDKRGWWNFVLPVDFDGDGDLDFIAGNHGLNSRLKADSMHPVKMYYSDFDGNGSKEQLITYFLGDKEIPFANKPDLEKQLPEIKKQFLYANDFAKASLTDIFSARQLEKATVYTADYFANSIIINNGKNGFAVKPLPWQTQLTSYHSAVVVNANNDALPNIWLGGNFYPNNIQLGRSDADFGSLLVNTGNGNFSYMPLNGIAIKGEIRHINKIVLANKKEGFVVARNNDSLLLIQKR